MKNTLFAIILLYGFNLNAQQAWTQEKGAGYFQIGSSLLSYSSLHQNQSGSIDLPRPINQLVLSAYVEYGLFDNLTASLTLPYHIVSSGDLESGWTGFSPKKGNLSALGNVNLGLTYKLHQKGNLVISSKVAVEVNTASFEVSTGLRSGFDATGVSPSILAGIGTPTFFASAEAGVSFLSNDYLPRFNFNAQIGKYFLSDDQLIFIFGITTTSTLGSPSAEDILKLDGNSLFTGLYINDSSYYAANLKLGYNFNQNWTIWSSLSGGAANNIGRNILYTLSLGYNLSNN